MSATTRYLHPAPSSGEYRASAWSALIVPDPPVVWGDQRGPEVPLVMVMEMDMGTVDPPPPLDTAQRLRELSDQLLRAEFEGRLFTSVFECLPDATLLVREDGTIHRANLQAAIVFGCRTGEDLLGVMVDALVPPAVRGRHAAHVAGYVAKPATRLMALGRRLRACRLDGSEFDADIALAPLYGEMGLLTIAVVRDVTSRQYYAEGTDAA